MTASADRLAAKDAANDQGGRFTTLTFERRLDAPVATVWKAWTEPAARQLWAAPTPAVTVEFLEAHSTAGGREVSLCKVASQPDIRCEVGWLEFDANRRSVNYELVSSEGVNQSAALVTADFSGDDAQGSIRVTVQLSSLAEDMEAGYRQGFDAGLANLAGVAERTMIIQRVIKAPLDTVWGAWVNPESLPKWWGPDGFSCKTSRIDLRTGGEWVFDMIGPDGTVYPNHHRYVEVRPKERLGYTLLWGENGPKHADAWVNFEAEGDRTRITLGMVMNTLEEYQTAKGFGAVELGQQTLGKLESLILSR